MFARASLDLLPSLFRKSVLALGFTLSLTCNGQLQSQSSSAEFDTVSIRPVPPVSDRQGPLHKNCTYSPERVDCQLSILELIEEAFKLKAFDIVGPDWLKTDVFALRATMPVGAGHTEAQSMLQRVLADRFGLAYHRGARPTRLYALVAGKHGLKLQPSADSKDRDKEKLSLDMPGGHQIRTSVVSQPGRFYAVAISLEDFATNYLSACVDAPVVNMTGANGEYKIDLRWEPTNAPGLSYAIQDPAFLSSAEEQLGLQLDRRIIPYNVLIVDHVNHMPTAN